MAAERNLCSKMLAATELARSRGLIDGDSSCPYIESCAGAACHVISLVSEEHKIVARQNVEYYDMIGKFFGKLLRYVEINGNRNKLNGSEYVELSDEHLQSDGAQTIFDRSRFNT